MIAESPHRDGTVFMTVARHKMGDYAPYVYRTDDFGTSWTMITNGLPEDDFCRVIREDPNRQGLLYVGTELGLYASFDDGATWQSLQANLPVCPVYDLIVKDTDMVVATHGRSFWILDDLTQLHQMHDDLAAASAHLFTPRDAVRTPPDLFADFWGAKGGKNYHVSIGQNATFYLEEQKTGHLVKHILDAGTDLERGVRITYWLKDVPAGEATLTILDSSGNEVDSFSSSIPVEEKDREGLYITADAGMNSFQWPMRHASGPKMVGSDFHGAPKGPLAIPGQYQAVLTVGDRSMTQDFNLLVDPRVDTAPEAFAAQFDLLKKIQDKMTDVINAVNRIRGMKKRLEDWGSRLDDLDGDTEAAKTGLDAALNDLAEVEDALVQSEFTTAGDTLNYREKLIEKLGALPPVVASADKAPTAQSIEVYEKLAGQIDEQLAALATVEQGSVAAVNSSLAELGVDIVG